MEKGAIGGGVEGTELLWGAASAAQLGWGVRSYAKGYAGDSRLMPIKAFAVASLFVGSAASASIVLLRANGIQKVDDLIEAGANLRAKLGLPPRTQKKFLTNVIRAVHGVPIPRNDAIASNGGSSCYPLSQ